MKYMKDSIKINKWMVMVNILIKIKIFMKENSKKIKNKDKKSYFTIIKIIIKEILSKMKYK